MDVRASSCYSFISIKRDRHENSNIGLFLTRTAALYQHRVAQPSQPSNNKPSAELEAEWIDMEWREEQRRIGPFLVITLLAFGLVVGSERAIAHPTSAPTSIRSAFFSRLSARSSLPPFLT